MVISILGIIFVLFLTYFSTKWLSVKATSITKSKYMNIVDRIVLGQNKYLAIIEISNKYYLISITDNNINIIKDLDEFELKISENTGESIEFNKIFSRFFKNKKL
ncbi:flagellar biosynthetic protein FliO [Sedimentibacter acidaminivorans]|nr:flagellar biosynthetic protein FliO [Sedimentibacter acidaminivorans]